MISASPSEKDNSLQQKVAILITVKILSPFPGVAHRAGGEAVFQNLEHVSLHSSSLLEIRQEVENFNVNVVAFVGASNCLCLPLSSWDGTTFDVKLRENSERWRRRRCALIMRTVIILPFIMFIK